MRHRSHLADRWARPFPDETPGINTAHHQRFVIALIGHLSGRDEREKKKKEKKKHPEKGEATARLISPFTTSFQNGAAGNRQIRRLE